MQDDLIRRQVVKEQMLKYGFHAPDMTVTEFIEDLPPVNPQEPKYCDRNICIKNEYNGIGCDECEVTKSQEPKTGHWEWVQYDYNPKLGNWHCSECRCVVVECVDKEEKGGIPSYKYCPQCGVKMESEEKENG